MKYSVPKMSRSRVSRNMQENKPILAGCLVKTLQQYKKGEMGKKAAHGDGKFHFQTRGCISERYFKVNVQFFLLAVCLDPLVQEPNVGGPDISQGEENRTPRKEKK